MQTNTGYKKINNSCGCKGTCTCPTVSTKITGTANYVTCPVVCNDFVVPAGATRILVKNTGLYSMEFTEDGSDKKELPKECDVDISADQLPEYEFFFNKENYPDDIDPQSASITICYPPGPGGKAKKDSILESVAA